MDMLTSVHIEGFKSIRDATIDLGPLNVLIGANGSGKTNFVAFMKMLKSMGGGDLPGFVSRSGGADALLHRGAKVTPDMAFDVEMQVDGEVSRFHEVLSTDGGDSLCPDNAQRWYPNFWTTWRTYHFLDTSPTAAVRRQHYIDDNHYLHSDGGNLAPYLYMLREVERPYYDRIVGAFRLAAPWFDDFVIEPLELRPEDVKLNWREKGSDRIYGPHQLSDGSLRTIALFTLLLQPEERLPSLIIIDEPELGLHPYVITLVAEALDAASTASQVIVTTQSVTFLNQFTPEHVVVVERDHDGGTTFERLSPEGLSAWLEEDFSVGELWEMNAIGGGP